LDSSVGRGPFPSFRCNLFAADEAGPENRFSLSRKSRDDQRHSGNDYRHRGNISGIGGKFSRYRCDVRRYCRNVPNEPLGLPRNRRSMARRRLIFSRLCFTMSSSRRKSSTRRRDASS
jgi:hypothetical protein